MQERTVEPLHKALRTLMESRDIRDGLELSGIADVAASTVSHYLNGKRGRVLDSRSLRTVEKLARALSVEPEYFLEYRQAKAEKLVREAMREGLISLEALEMLVEGARVRKGTESE